jgi:CspA family cold shock protein
MHSGKITLYNEDKGFGFITPNEGENDLFFHISSLTYKAEKEDKVVFDTENTDKGLNAINISKKAPRVVTIEGFNGNDK